MRRFSFSTCVMILVVGMLVVASGPARAGFVVTFDDPATQGTDYRIEDNGPLDVDDSQEVGFISIAIADGNLDVVASAASKGRLGGAESPELVISINALRYSLGSLEISVTDTGFNVGEESRGEAQVMSIFIEGGESISFDFFGDSDDQEFTKGFPILTSETVYPPKVSYNITNLNGPADPVGSLTISAFVPQGSGTDFEVNLAYTQYLRLVIGNEPPLPTEPEASFTWSPSDPAVGQTVHFTDTSTGGAIESWEWDFDDGETSTEKNPAHTYTEEGRYDVKLTVTNAAGDSDVREDVNVSSSVDQPDASFTYEPSNPAVGQAVRFTDTSTGGGIESWEWDFDDGGASTQKNPTHAFDEDGLFTVKLTVTNSAGDSDASEAIDVEGGPNLNQSYFIPAASLAAGAEGSFFQTDVDVNNSDDDTATFRFLWLPRGADNANPTTSESFNLVAGASARYENVLGEVFGLAPNVNGALWLSSDSNALVIMSRTYNLPTGGASGTFGQAISAVPSSALIENGEVGRIVFMSENPDFRTNLGCVNGVDDNLTISIDLYDDGGTLLETKTMNLAPYSNQQINKIFGAHDPINGYADVWADEAGAAFYCYGSMLDNGSSDPTTIVPVLLH